MSAGAVFVWAAPFQLMGFISLELGEKVPLLCFFDLFFGHSGQKTASCNENPAALSRFLGKRVDFEG